MNDERDGGAAASKRWIFGQLPWSLAGWAYRLGTGSLGRASRFRRSHVGANSFVDPSVQIVGWKNVRVGSNTAISQDTWLNVNHRDEASVRIRIGDNCHIGRRNFFSSGPLINIKDYGFTGLDCHFLGCGHNIASPLVPYLASGLTPGGIIEVGVNCWLATAVTVFENVRIGCGTVVGAQSVVATDLPAFSVAAGNPCKVIKRFDFRSNVWVRSVDWVDSSDQYMPSEAQYLLQLKEDYAAIAPSLIAASRRFGWL